MNVPPTFEYERVGLFFVYNLTHIMDGGYMGFFFLGQVKLKKREYLEDFPPRNIVVAGDTARQIRWISTDCNWW